MWFSSSRTARRTSPTCRRLGLERFEDRCQPSAGVLDPTFGTGGTVTPAVTANAVFVQPWDGKIVVAGSSGTVMALARYNANGTLDTTFGVGGKETTTFTGAIARVTEYSRTGTANDGKILAAAAGSVVRFNTNGSVDTTFGSNGKATLPWSYAESSVAIGSDGKIVVSGMNPAYIPRGSNHISFSLSRLNANGSLDTTFATNGTYSGGGQTMSPYTHTLYQSGAYALVQPDGKILVDHPEGYNNSPCEGWTLVRLTVSGALDSTFNNNWVTGFGSSVFALNGAAAPGGFAVYPASDAADAGKILAVGYTYQAYSSAEPRGGSTVLARYNADGTLDTTFGSGGKVITANGGIVNDVAIQPDGKAVLVGVAMPAEGVQNLVPAEMKRYNTDGTLDTTFGTGGFVSTAYNRVAVQPDGRIDVAGTAALARYLASQPQIGSFTAVVNPVPSGGSETLTVSNITDGNPNNNIPQIEFYYIDGTGTQQLLGNGTQTSPGVWTLTFTVGVPAGSYSVFAQAQDSLGVFGDPVGLTLQVV